MDVVYANQTTHITRGEFAGLSIEVGSRWDASDPLVKARPDLFTPDGGPVRTTRTDSGFVEQATARPGEKRNVRRA